MSRFLLAFLLIIPTIYAKIHIDVTASKNAGENQVVFHGKNEDVITDQEQATFNLQDDELKSYVQQFYGAEPTQAFLKSPTPWGDLYKTYKWPQVKRVLTAQKARVLSVDSEPTVISSKVLDNRNIAEATFKVKIEDTLDFNVSSTWMKDGELSADKDIKYDFDIRKGKDGKGRKHLSFTAKWGENVEKSEPVTVEQEFEIFLQTPQTLIAELHAIKNTVKLQIDYEATLAGSTAVYYSDMYKGHQFWSLDIKSVMDAGGVKPVLSSEMIDISYFTNVRVLIRDASTGYVVYTIHMKDQY